MNSQLTGASAIPEPGALRFCAEMHCVQLSQVADLLGAAPPGPGEPPGPGPGAAAASAAGRARDLVAQWRRLQLAESAPLTHPEQPWAWVTRRGMTALGLSWRAGTVPRSRLRHTQAVTDARLALARTPQYRRAGASWRPEREMLHRAFRPSGGWPRAHLPDGEVHWPAGCGLDWAGETWAIEVELTRKGVERTTQIMRDLLARTGDYDCPPAEAAVPGDPPRYACVAYACARAVLATVRTARGRLGPLGDRVEVYEIFPPATPFHGPGREQSRS
ncbi:MAG TPA: hypothetical protein VH478_03050 [Trebonia sp.]|jgi:hypothetical protein|nr:hypothetical protein [Trebonia sp.]